MGAEFLIKMRPEAHSSAPPKCSVGYSNRTAYGLHGNTFYQRVTGKWVEIAGAKVHFREVSKEKFPRIHESFLEFLLEKELSETKPLLGWEHPSEHLSV